MPPRLRVLLAAAASLVLLSGCLPAGPCTPATCADLVAECGEIADGCGGTLACGTCPEGGGCVGNQCLCVPKTCAGEGKNCGEIDDGCGGTKNCGDCPGAQVCGGTSPNVCGNAPCTPKTCEELGVVCGRVSDGCRRTLSCDRCEEGTACSTNQCVSCEGTSWEGTAKPWFEQNCVGCHRANHTWLRTRSQVRLKSAQIRSYVSSGLMPDDRTLTAEEKQVILTWLDCGMP